MLPGTYRVVAVVVVAAFAVVAVGMHIRIAW